MVSTQRQVGTLGGPKLLEGVASTLQMCRAGGAGSLGIQPDSASLGPAFLPVKEDVPQTVSGPRSVGLSCRMGWFGAAVWALLAQREISSQTGLRPASLRGGDLEQV